MAIITTETNKPATIPVPAPPSAALAAAAQSPTLVSVDERIAAERANIDTNAANDDSDVDINIVPATVSNPEPLNPAKAKLAALKAEAENNARIKKEAEAKAKAEKEAAKNAGKATKDAEKAAAAAKKAEEKAAADKVKADAKATKDAEKAAAKAKKDAEKAEAKAKRDAVRNTPAPLLPPVEVKGAPESMIKTLQSGKASTALKAAFSAESNAELGYKELGGRYNWSVKDLVADLVAEKVWPVKEDGTAWGYQKLYQTERDNNLISWGHMVNRASERFTMLNPANIEKREAAKKELERKRLEEAALEAAGLAAQTSNVTTKTTTTATSNAQMDVSGMTQEQLCTLAKACILAMDDNFRNVLCADEEIQKALNLVG